jgi:hypothetical protein
MLWKKTQGGHCEPLPLFHYITSAVKKNTQKAIAAPFLLPIVVGAVKTKLKGGASPPPFQVETNVIKKNMRGPLRLPFPLVIIIVARKTHARRNATVVCYKRRGTQCHIFMLLL